MEKLKDENVKVSFEKAEEMTSFLKEMEASDEYYPLKLNSIKTYVDDGEPMLFAKTEDGEDAYIPLWPFSIKSLEKRSGDNASGHALMTEEQILDSMNNYWPLHGDKKTCVARVRGGKLMGLGSEQYESISQNEMIEAVVKWLEANHPDGYVFKGGYYTHQLTEADFEITDSISASYRAAWNKAGLPAGLLQQSKITAHVMTDDTAECAAKAILEMNVCGTRFLLGNPIEIQHRAGYGGVENFSKELNKADLSIKTELDALAKLMDVNLLHPESATVMALKKAKIDKITKKACKELVEDMMFGATENAYVVYLFLHGILDTVNGQKLSEERKFRVVTALRTLLTEDWKKFDVPSASL